jgi:hypothetical protein
MADGMSSLQRAAQVIRRWVPSPGTPDRTYWPLSSRGSSDSMHARRRLPVCVARIAPDTARRQPKATCPADANRITPSSPDLFRAAFFSVLVSLYAVQGLLGSPVRLLGPCERRHRPQTESSVALSRGCRPRFTHGIRVRGMVNRCLLVVEHVSAEVMGTLVIVELCLVSVAGDCASSRAENVLRALLGTSRADPPLPCS